MWYENPLTSKLGIKYPVIQAPMAGGPTTPQLVAAISNGGGLGSLGAGYSDPPALRKSIESIQKLTKNPFAVNLFVPGKYSTDPEKIKKITEILKPYFREAGLDEIKEVRPLIEHYEQQLQLLMEYRVPVISFTFGAPEKETVRSLKCSGVVTIGTATTVDEAMDLESRGIDIIVAQGFEAGGHRGTYLGSPEDNLVGTISLVPQVADSVDIPVAAAGGIMDGRGIAAALSLGAYGVQLGTAFLTCTESGAHELHKKAILNSTEKDTVLTKVFSGKLARGLKNRFTEEMERYESYIPDYPVQNSITRDLRKASAAKGKTDFMSLWSGQGVRMSRSLTAAELLHSLITETETVIRKLTDNPLNPSG